MTHVMKSGWPSGPEEPRTFSSMDGGVQVQTTALRPDRYSFFNTAPNGPTSIARGGGLSFAAASFGAGEKSIELGAFDRVLDYDPASGQVEVEAGITLEKLFRFLTPRGRYLPVQPGYGLIAVGGCIGCGVHGKNPARDGTFLSQVVSLRLFHPDHGIIALSSTEEPELFRATYAGFGMMGVIVSAVLRTRALAGWSTETTVHPVESASEVAALLPQIADKSDLAYGWLDCAWPRSSSFGRGLVLDIRFTAGGTPDITLPAGRLSPAYGRKLPICLLNRWSARAINLAHVYRSRRAVGPRVNGLPKVLFPAYGNEVYFRLFGRSGLHEYQVILPHARVGDCLALARELASRFFVVITLVIVRVFTGRSDLLHFDGDGTSVAFHVPRSPASVRFLAGLDAFVVEAGGRPNIYKDSRLPRAVFEATYPEAEEFRAIRQSWDPKRRFSSELSERLGL